MRVHLLCYCLLVLLIAQDINTHQNATEVISISPESPDVEVNKTTSRIPTYGNTCGIHVEPFLDARKNVYLNLTWGDFKEPINLKKILFVLEECGGYKGNISINFFFTDIRMDKQTYIVLPPSHEYIDDGLKIEPGCKFHLNITNLNWICEYKVQSCVDTVCDCAAENTPFDFHLQNIADEIYELHWSKSGDYDIKNVTFRINHGDTNHTDLPPLAQAEDFNYKSGSFRLRIGKEHLDPQTANYFLGRFINENDCPSSGFAEIDDVISTANISWISWLWPVLIITILVLIVFYQHFRRRKKIRIILESQGQALPLKTLNPLYPSVNNLIVMNNEYEIRPEKIKILKKIGGGNFGQVYLVENISSDPSWKCAAAKSLIVSSTNGDKYQEFENEILLMQQIGHHPNIIKLIGFCLETKPYQIIMEFAPHGDLRNYLLEMRKFYEQNIISVIGSDSANSVFTESGSKSDCIYISGPDSPTSYTYNKINGQMVRESVTTQVTNLSESEVPLFKRQTSYLDCNELRDFALQIANGMAHLEKLGITHRDLAARNILMGEEKTLKISDFGMSRNISYVMQANKKKAVPIRWMAIETITNLNSYSSKSDVWSFGVVLWEIGTLGAFPYDKEDDLSLLRLLKDGLRLSMPRVCTEDLYKIMLKCWSADPNNRPSFQDLLVQLRNKDVIYVELEQIERGFRFPPTDKDI